MNACGPHGSLNTEHSQRLSPVNTYMQAQAGLTVIANRKYLTYMLLLRC